MITTKLSPAKFRTIEQYLNWPNYLRQSDIKSISGTLYFHWQDDIHSEWVNENKAYKIACQNKRDFS